MIGKVPRPGRGFRGLVSYLLHRDGRAPGGSRVAWTATRNLVIDDPERAPVVMRITARKSVRVAKPVYHFVISWHRNERVTPDIMRQVADTTCRDLALDDHQRLYIAHHDTQNPHVHIVVNRVHPETGLAWQTSHDYRRIEQSLARQALDLGLAVVPGRHNGRVAPETLPRRARDGAFQQARRENISTPVRGRMSTEDIDQFRSTLRPLFLAARSWAELDASLALFGLGFVRKGQGVVIASTSAEMKLSDLGAGIRLAALEQRFGRWTVSTLARSHIDQQHLISVPRRRRERER